MLKSLFQHQQKPLVISGTINGVRSPGYTSSDIAQVERFGQEETYGEAKDRFLEEADIQKSFHTDSGLPALNIK